MTRNAAATDYVEGRAAAAAAAAATDYVEGRAAAAAAATDYMGGRAAAAAAAAGRRSDVGLREARAVRC